MPGLLSTIDHSLDPSTVQGEDFIPVVQSTEFQKERMGKQTKKQRRKRGTNPTTLQVALTE